MNDEVKLERVIRYTLRDTILPQQEMIVPADTTDGEARTIALTLNGLLYERRVTPWTHVVSHRKG